MPASLFQTPKIANSFSDHAELILYEGDALSFLKTIPSNMISLVVTSPPYNLGKEYERKKALAAYLEEQAEVIDQLVRTLKPEGSICWEVGNFVEEGEVYPLDAYFYDCPASAGNGVFAIKLMENTHAQTPEAFHA